MKRKSKIFILFFSSAVILTSIASPLTSSSSHASAATQSNSVEIQKNDFIKSNAYSKKQNPNGSITYSISDYDYAQSLKANGQTEVANKITQQLQERKIHKGVNKVTIDNNGNYTIKVSKTVAQAVAATGAGAVGGAITILINAIPGLGQLGSTVTAGATVGLVSFLATSGVKGGVYIKGKGASVTGIGWQ
ncbi:hypothetical protein [Staphylococcus ratti]|uniref:Pathogenicity island protein n=1 Tax=Staphylococcus ratti TaxID=2892440 RepID=A0ABY3PCL7_9STAP|nr:hypothetical protein [Staphylococcus ratti]UEX90069.1 hypothetical protein LN051_11155 [Staphylococcus ratti]